MLVFVFSQELHYQDVTVAKVTRWFHCGDGGQIDSRVVKHKG